MTKLFVVRAYVFDTPIAIFKNRADADKFVATYFPAGPADVTETPLYADFESAPVPQPAPTFRGDS